MVDEAFRMQRLPDIAARGSVTCQVGRGLISARDPFGFAQGRLFLCLKNGSVRIEMTQQRRLSDTLNLSC